MLRVHGLNTVGAQMKQSWIHSPRTGPSRVLQVMLDRQWSETLPMLVWVIEHPREGILLVDAGEHPRSQRSDFGPAINRLLTRNMARFPGAFEAPLTEQLKGLGLQAADVQHIVITHLHQDHVGQLDSFPRAKVWVSAPEWAAAQQPQAHLKGYWKDLFPAHFQPHTLQYTGGPFFNFPHSQQLFEDVWVVATPGHAPGHQSVVVRQGGRFLVLAGDVTPTFKSLQNRSLDMVSALGDPRGALQTIDRMRAFVEGQNAVYLPSHCPESLLRLQQAQSPGV